MNQQEFLRCRGWDPDGFAQEPTEADYRAFEQWVTATYGPDAYRQYQDYVLPSSDV